MQQIIFGRYTVWHGVEDQKSTKQAQCFVDWDGWMTHPVFDNRVDMAKRFVSESDAEKTAQRLGKGWEVVDMWLVMSDNERQLWESLERIYNNGEQHNEEKPNN